MSECLKTTVYVAIYDLQLWVKPEDRTLKKRWNAMQCSPPQISTGGLPVSNIIDN